MIVSTKAVIDGLDLCSLARVVILPVDAPPAGRGTSCLLIDRDMLGQSGAIAVYDDLTLVKTRAAKRLWSP